MLSLSLSLSLSLCVCVCVCVCVFNQCKGIHSWTSVGHTATGYNNSCEGIWGTCFLFLMEKIHLHCRRVYHIQNFRMMKKHVIDIDVSDWLKVRAYIHSWVGLGYVGSVWGLVCHLVWSLHPNGIRTSRSPVESIFLGPRAVLCSLRDHLHIYYTLLKDPSWNPAYLIHKYASFPCLTGLVKKLP